MQNRSRAVRDQTWPLELHIESKCERGMRVLLLFLVLVVWRREVGKGPRFQRMEGGSFPRMGRRCQCPSD
jgi:hypothetical protein